MKKVCDHWQDYLSSSGASNHLFAEFETRAKNVSAEVFRVATALEAKEVVVNLAKYVNARKIVLASSPLQQAAGVTEGLRAAGIEVYLQADEIAIHAESADMGISTVEFGIAETGSVCQDALAIESRMVSMLPPIHVVFLQSSRILPGVVEAMDVISQVYDRGYISFITGPSRTADIERVLTIGVHGPGRFVIIAVDEEVCGGGDR